LKCGLSFRHVADEQHQVRLEICELFLRECPRRRFDAYVLGTVVRRRRPDRSARGDQSECDWKANQTEENSLFAQSHGAASRNQEKTFGQDEQDLQDKIFLFCYFRILFILSEILL
jgi:hypothetical protein